MSRFAGFGTGLGVGAVVGLGLGWALGLRIAGRPANESAATATARPAPARRAVCAPAPGAADAVEPEATALALRLCEARLAEKARVQPTARQPWPDTLPDADEPGAWQEQVDAAVAACAPAATAELTDCEEYPCVQALRPRPDADPYALADALNGCLGPRLGSAGYEDGGAVVVRARCPDGREEPVLLVTAATRDGAAAALPPAELEGFGSIVYLGMLMGRRAESALQLWPCRDEG